MSLRFIELLFRVYRLWFTVDGVKIKEGREKSLPSLFYWLLLLFFFNYLEGDGAVVQRDVIKRYFHMNYKKFLCGISDICARLVYSL